MAINWFPIRKDLLNSEEYHSLSPTEKVFLFQLISDSNICNDPDGWYKADIEYSAIINASVETVRKARRKLQKLNLITFIPGHKKGNRGFSTHYKSVKHSRPPEKGSRVFFAQAPRYQFDCTIRHIRRERWTHKEAVIYMVLTYFYHKYSDENNFFVSKSDLIRYAGFNNILQPIKSLYDNWNFSGDSHLFEYVAKHQKIQFYKWATSSDPDENKSNREQQEKEREELAQKIEIKRSQHKKISEKRERKQKKKRKDIIKELPPEVRESIKGTEVENSTRALERLKKGCDLSRSVGSTE